MREFLRTGAREPDSRSAPDRLMITDAIRAAPPNGRGVTWLPRSVGGGAVLRLWARCLSVIGRQRRREN
jgi:hypothetical protein